MFAVYLHRFCPNVSVPDLGTKSIAIREASWHAKYYSTLHVFGNQPVCWKIVTRSPGSLVQTWVTAVYPQAYSNILQLPLDVKNTSLQQLANQDEDLVCCGEESEQNLIWAGKNSYNSFHSLQYLWIPLEGDLTQKPRDFAAGFYHVFAQVKRSLM